jgi:peptidoglycan hydrolase CwlO-like protein
MIKTATDEDLKRIADRMFETQRTEFLGKILAVVKVVEDLGNHVTNLSNAQSTANREIVSNHQGAMYRLTQTDAAIEDLRKQIAALSTRAANNEHGMRDAQSRSDAALERVQARMNKALDAFAKIENAHGK